MTTHIDELEALAWAAAPSSSRSRFPTPFRHWVFHQRGNEVAIAEQALKWIVDLQKLFLFMGGFDWIPVISQYFFAQGLLAIKEVKEAAVTCRYRHVKGDVKTVISILGAEKSKGNFTLYALHGWKNSTTKLLKSFTLTCVLVEKN